MYLREMAYRYLLQYRALNVVLLLNAMIAWVAYSYPHFVNDKSKKRTLPKDTHNKKARRSESKPAIPECAAMYLQGCVQGCTPLKRKFS